MTATSMDTSAKTNKQQDRKPKAKAARKHTHEATSTTIAQPPQRQARVIDVGELFAMASTTSGDSAELRYAAHTGKHVHEPTTTRPQQRPQQPTAVAPQRQRAVTAPGQSPTTVGGRARTTTGVRTPPKITSTNFATPAYADSPAARELPPPPSNWLSTGGAIKQSSTPLRRVHHAQTATTTTPLTGVELLRHFAIAQAAAN